MEMFHDRNKVIKSLNVVSITVISHTATIENNIIIIIFFVCSRMKPADFDYLKVIGKGSFGKVQIF